MPWECHQQPSVCLNPTTTNWVSRFSVSCNNSLAISTYFGKRQRYLALPESCSSLIPVANPPQSVQQNDPFLYRTLSRALTAFENKRPYHKLPIEAGLIVGPLKVLLARPDKAIIRRLKVLEARYTRYKVGPDMASGRAFEPTTEFFTVLSKQSAPTIAWKMTQDVLQGFGKITLDGLVSHNGHLRDLAVQWDELSHNVEEVAVAGGQEDKLRDIARVRTFCLLFS